VLGLLGALIGIPPVVDHLVVRVPAVGGGSPGDQQLVDVLRGAAMRLQALRLRGVGKRGHEAGRLLTRRRITGEVRRRWQGKIPTALASISGSLWASVAARTGESYAKVNHKRGE